MDFDSFVLAAATADLRDEPDARAYADAVEFRMDLAAAPLSALDGYDGDLPVIATNRVEGQGGEAPDTPERLDALRAAAEHPAVEAVDVELPTVTDGAGQGVIEHARASGAAAIVSTHDFEGTPPRDGMCDRLAAACERGDVGKLAVTARSPDDTLDLLAVTRECDARGECVATMAMGAAGRHSRAVAPVYGSRVGYAPVAPERATAPGQYDLATLSDLIEKLR